MKKFLLSFLFLLSLSAIKAGAELKVNTQRLEDISVEQSYQYPAQAIALQRVTLSSQIPAVVTSTKLPIGTPVKKNQTLVTLDCTDNVLAKEQALAALKRLQVEQDLAQQQLQRAQKLVSVKSISKQELDQRRTALDAAVASLEQQDVALKIIDHNITKCNIKAPFSGTIIDNQANQQSFANSGIPLITLINPKSIEIEAKLPLTVSEQIKASNGIKFLQNSKNYSIQPRSFLPQVDTLSKQQIIRFSINGSGFPLAQSIGQITWNDPKLFIPSKYIVQRNGQLGIFIAQNNQAHFHALSHAIEGQNTHVNLSGNTLIIIDKLLLLNDKDEIS